MSGYVCITFEMPIILDKVLGQRAKKNCVVLKTVTLMQTVGLM